MRTALLTVTVPISALALIAPFAPTSSAAPADDPRPPSWLQLQDGAPTAQFDAGQAIVTNAMVQTPVDSDGDGKRDLVHIEITRPKETSDGRKVPVIFEHSPYRGDLGNPPNHDVDYTQLPQEYQSPGARSRSGAFGSPLNKAVPAMSSLAKYWVPRGYAVVRGSSIGSEQSTGCPTVGDQAETLATKAVIDWLNGRAPAWDTDGTAINADWSTGNVGMTGVSYNGTLPNQVATTGVEGLRTIVPIAAISNWYDYYRSNGLVRAPHSAAGAVGTNGYQGEDLDILAKFDAGPAREQSCRHVFDRLATQQDRITGDVNKAWDQRNYRPKAGQVKASVFVVHGLADFNVTTDQAAAWWQGLAKAGVPRKITWHNGGHGNPKDDGQYKRDLDRWMARWLYGVQNGIEKEPQASVQRPDGHYDKAASWPQPGATAKALKLGAPNSTEPGTLSTKAPSGPKPRQSFVDSGKTRPIDADLMTKPDQADPNRLIYLTQPLTKAATISGTPSLKLKASVDNRYAANLTAVLVDYGPSGSTAAPKMLTRGWMDVQNRKAMNKSTPIQQGQEYTFDFPMLPTDAIVPAGHRIGLVVASTDQQFTLRPDAGTKLTVNPAQSTFSLPTVGKLG